MSVIYGWCSRLRGAGRAAARATAACAAAAWVAGAGAADASFALGGSVGAMAALTGVNTAPLASGSTYNFAGQMQSIGVKRVRTHDFYGPLDMAVMYPDRSKDPNQLSSFNFAQSDSYFAAIRDGGFEPYFRLGDSSSNSTPPPDGYLANWVQAGVNVVRHYRSGQWNGFTTVLPHVEIWNEPDSSHFWPPPYTPTQFYRLYADTAKALRTAFPDLKIGGPGVTQGTAQTSAGQAWLRGFLDYVRSSGAPLDFLSWHAYTNTPSDFSTAAAFYRAELDARGFTATEQHVTEWNTDSSNPPSGISAADVRTGGAGAAINTANWITLQEAGIPLAMFYRAFEPAMSVGSTFYGMFIGDGSPKKVALAAQLWNEAARYPTRLAVATSGTTSGLKVLGASNAAGQYALLVANTSATARTWTFALPGGAPLANYRMHLQTVNDGNAQVQHSLPASTTISLPGYTTQLLVLTPAGTAEAGFWWNAAESGRGFTLERQGSAAFAAAYLYESAGPAVWYYGAATVQGDGSFSGPMLALTGGQSLTGSYRAPIAAASPGNWTFSFSSATQATLTWPGGTLSLTRFPFGAGGFAAPPGVFQPETGWWWNWQESGRGYAIEVQGGSIFVATYVYDGAGNPTWYAAGGTLDGQNFDGTWQQYAGGQTLTGGYQAATLVNPAAGALRLRFITTAAAMLTLPDGREIPIVRFRFEP